MVELLAELPDVFYGFSLTFQHISKGLWSDTYRSSHEFGDVIALHELSVKIRIGFRQLERFVKFPISIDMSKERTGIDPIIATTAEYKPSGIA